MMYLLVERINMLDINYLFIAATALIFTAVGFYSGKRYMLHVLHKLARDISIVEMGVVDIAIGTKRKRKTKKLSRDTKKGKKK